MRWSDRSDGGRHARAVTTEVLVRTTKAARLTVLAVLHLMVSTAEHDEHGEHGAADDADEAGATDDNDADEASDDDGTDNNAGDVNSFGPNERRHQLRWRLEADDNDADDNPGW